MFSDADGMEKGGGPLEIRALNAMSPLAGLTSGTISRHCNLPIPILEEAASRTWCLELPTVVQNDSL